MAFTFLITGASGLIGFRLLLAVLNGGHVVHYAVRSADKARIVSSNPAVVKMSPGNRLVPVVISDFTAENAFDDALQGVTHVLHAGSPVPMPYFEPKSQIFEPTVRITANILSAALKSTSIQKIVITSSVVANTGAIPPRATVTARTRVPLPEPLPSIYGDPLTAYTMGKMVEIHQTDDFIQQRSPEFSVTHVILAYIFGRNELVLDAEAMQTANSSNNCLISGMLGREWPFPLHGGFAHIDDVAEVHMKAALDPSPLRAYGVSSKVDYSRVFDIVEKAFPEAVANGIFTRGQVPTLPMEYDASETEKTMGIHFKSFDSAVEDVAAQYLEKLGKDKQR